MSQFSPDLIKSANRNWAAAERLNTGPVRDRTTAGYLYGIAAECAVKARYRSLHWTKDSRDGAAFAHFPAIKQKLRDELSGRLDGGLVRFAEDSYLRGWAIDIRYSDGTCPDDKMLEMWRSDADTALATLL
ncbi:MAG: hypothetical protein EAZ99_12095 [Alphaproteobacteria bacterium]|nr:MAG: hypothetical protein EAZ99_12095 [Alphaproteobacteria bacterium]